MSGDTDFVPIEESPGLLDSLDKNLIRLTREAQPNPRPRPAASRILADWYEKRGFPEVAREARNHFPLSALADHIKATTGRGVGPWSLINYVNGCPLDNGGYTDR